MKPLTILCPNPQYKVQLEELHELDHIYSHEQSKLVSNSSYSCHNFEQTIYFHFCENNFHSPKIFLACFFFLHHLFNIANIFKVCLSSEKKKKTFLNSSLDRKTFALSSNSSSVQSLKVLIFLSFSTIFFVYSCYHFSVNLPHLQGRTLEILPCF